MIPARERELLLQAVSVAADLAAVGRFAEGYDHLLLGLRRAEALEREGLPYGEALVRRYRALRNTYMRRHSALWSCGQEGEG